MKNESNTAMYTIGGINYTVVRKFDSESGANELVQGVLNRLIYSRILTDSRKNDKIEPYVAGSH